MRASASSWCRSRRRNGWPSRPTSSTASSSASGATARSSGPASPAATAGDAAVPAASASSTDGSGAPSPAVANDLGLPQHHGPVGRELRRARVRRAAARARVRCRRRTQARRLRARRVADRGTVRPARHSSTDAPSTSSISRTSKSTRSLVGEHDRELVDRDVFAAFEHVDARRCRRRSHRCATQRVRARRDGRGATRERGDSARRQVSTCS